MIENIDFYLKAIEEQDQRFRKRWKEIRKNGPDMWERVQEQNKKYGYSTTPDEEWFALGGQVVIMLHGGAKRGKPQLPVKKIVYPHNHDFFEMSYVYQGVFHNIVEGEEIDQPKNTLVLLSPQARHRCYTTSEDDIVFNFLIKRELVENIFLQMFSESESVCRFFLDSLYNVRQKRPYLLFACDDSLVELIHSIMEEYFHKEDFYQSIIGAKLIELFSRLSRVYQANEMDVPLKESHYQMMVQVEEYMEKNYSTVTLASMAEHFNYTPSYLSKLIQKNFHQKFSSLLQEIRLKHACRYLSHSSLPVDQVIEIVGYNDVSYFYRVFKQKYGMAPNQYRKQFSTLHPSKT